MLGAFQPNLAAPANSQSISMLYAPRQYKPQDPCCSTFRNCSSSYPESSPSIPDPLPDLILPSTPTRLIISPHLLHPPLHPSATSRDPPILQHVPLHDSDSHTLLASLPTIHTLTNGLCHMSTPVPAHLHRRNPRSLSPCILRLVSTSVAPLQPDLPRLPSLVYGRPIASWTGWPSPPGTTERWWIFSAYVTLYSYSDTCSVDLNPWPPTWAGASTHWPVHVCNRWSTHRWAAHAFPRTLGTARQSTCSTTWWRRWVEWRIVRHGTEQHDPRKGRWAWFQWHHGSGGRPSSSNERTGRSSHLTSCMIWKSDISKNWSEQCDCSCSVDGRTTVGCLFPKDAMSTGHMCLFPVVGIYCILRASRCLVKALILQFADDAGWLFIIF